MTSFKLYYSPTSCGAASFVTATIGDLTFESETVDLRSHRTKSGVDFYTINPKGNVPTIVFSDGTILNENVAALTYLADQGNAGLAPPNGTPERYQYLNHIAFVATELHKSFSPLFNPSLTPDARKTTVAGVLRRTEMLSTFLRGNAFLNGKSLSAADIYACIVLSWAGSTAVELQTPIQSYLDGLKADERIASALSAMEALQ